MAYLALYRKYRPKTFDEVVGQSFVTRILKNQILSDRIGHAYLLTGIRGTGKTSIAKIFARAINCPHNTDGNPCNTCETCTSIERAGVMDIIEIDAASNRGVDEIREIRDKVVYPPKIGRYKVYIIDEVHMLTKEAFNALLKTLEEPPAHVVFILATTEPNKLPATILSRCQRYDIRPITREMITAQLQKILDDVDVKMEPAAVNFIAQRGDHSMRDALSILDQVIDIRQGDACITYEEVLDFLGMANRETIKALIDAIVKSEGAKVLSILAQLYQKGSDSALLMDQIIDGLRELVVVKEAGVGASDILGLSIEEVDTLRSFMDGQTSGKLFQMIDGLIEDRQKMRFSHLGDIILEMALLKHCVPGPIVPSAETVTVKSAPILKINSLTDNLSMKKGNSQSVCSLQKEKESDRFGDSKQGIVNEPFSEKVALFEETDSVTSDHEKPIDLSSQVTEHKEKALEILSENPSKENSDDGDLTAIDRALKAWALSKDFLISDMVSRGKLHVHGNDHYVMTYITPDENMYLSLFTKALQAEAGKALETAVGHTVAFSVKAVTKQYETMSMSEKVTAIVGEKYAGIVVEKNRRD